MRDDLRNCWQLSFMFENNCVHQSPTRLLHSIWLRRRDESFNKPNTRKWFNSIFSGMWICRTWHASVRNEQKPIIRGGIISTFHLKFPPDAYTKNNSCSESFLRASSSTPENACFPISSLLPHNKLLLGVAFISFPPPRIIFLCHARICFVFQPSMTKFPRH